MFFSSHLLYEIEPVADIVAIVDHGRIVKQAPIEQLRHQVKGDSAPRERFLVMAPLPNGNVLVGGNSLHIVTPPER